MCHATYSSVSIAYCTALHIYALSIGVHDISVQFCKYILSLGVHDISFTVLHIYCP